MARLKNMKPGFRQSQKKKKKNIGQTEQSKPNTKLTIMKRGSIKLI